MEDLDPVLRSRILVLDVPLPPKISAWRVGLFCFLWKPLHGKEPPCGGDLASGDIPVLQKFITFASSVMERFGECLREVLTVLMYSPAAIFLVAPSLGGFRVRFPGEDLFSFLLQNFHLIDYHLAAFITVMLARRLVWAIISEVTFPLFPLLPVELAAEHDHPWPKKILQVGGFLPSEKSGCEGLRF